MVKILHISTAHNPFDIRIYKKEVKSLIKHGYDVKFLVPTFNISEVSDNHIFVKKSKNRIKRMVFDNYNIYKKVCEIKPEIIHFHDPEFLPYALILKKKQNIKVIYDAHEDLPNAILSKSYINKNARKFVSVVAKLIEDNISKKLDFIVTATPFIERKFLKINNNTVCINNYPLLDELFTVENTLKENAVCYVGGLSKIRGSEQLSLSSNNTSTKIYIAGNTKDLLDDHNLELLGNLSREEVANLMSKSIAGIVTFLPEPNHINARPNKMFEYMSAGLPVISSNFSEWKNIIDSNKCGVTVNPKAPEQISNAIDYLVANPEIAKKMGENGRDAVVTKFNWNNEEKNLINIYKKLEEN